MHSREPIDVDLVSPANLHVCSQQVCIPLGMMGMCCEMDTYASLKLDTLVTDARVMGRSFATGCRYRQVTCIRSVVVVPSNSI